MYCLCLKFKGFLAAATLFIFYGIFFITICTFTSYFHSPRVHSLSKVTFSALFMFFIFLRTKCAAHFKILEFLVYLQDLVTFSNRGIILYFIFYICTVFNTAPSAAPSGSTLSEDAGIEPRTVATPALAVRRSNHRARSHPHKARSHPS
jgi:hypothetical protein